MHQVSKVELEVFFIFSIIIIIPQTYKKMTVSRYYFIFSVSGKEKKQETAIHDDY